MLLKQIGWMKLEIRKNWDLSKKKLSENSGYNQLTKLTDSKLFKKSTKGKTRKICEKISINFELKKLKASKKKKKMKSQKFAVGWKFIERR